MPVSIMRPSIRVFKVDLLKYGHYGDVMPAIADPVRLSLGFRDSGNALVIFG